MWSQSHCLSLYAHSLLILWTVVCTGNAVLLAGIPSGQTEVSQCLAHFFQPCVPCLGRVLRMPVVALAAHPPEMTAPSFLEGMWLLPMQVGSSSGLNGSLFCGQACGEAAQEGVCM